MPIDVDRAEAFVRAHGDEFDQVVLDELLAGEDTLSPDVIQRFFAGQRPDGGWAPFWAPDYSSLDATCFKLAQAETLMGLYGESCRHALDFLKARQRADGSWEEDVSQRKVAPPWATPGDLASHVYLTANCGWWLANARAYGYTAYLGSARQAGDYLLQQLSSDGSLPSFLQAHWLAAALWIRLNGQRPPVLPEPSLRVLDHLWTHLTDDVPSGALAWMVTTLAPVMATEHSAMTRATDLLASQQRADGSWASEDGSDRDAYVTREALRALIMWGAI